MFHFIAKPMASALNFFYGLIPNYGIAIVLLTVAVMLLLTPFTVKSTRSMLAMQRLQPELKRLQAEHKNDRQALNEAMMAFYKEHNVNPLSGCLPMLLQMPVFFGLYEAIRGLTHNPPTDLSHSSKLFTSLCPNFNQLANACGGGNKHFVVQIKVLGVDLAQKVSANHGSFAKGLPFYALIALTTLTQYYQQRQISNRNPQAAAANPQMQMMQKFFPIIFLVIYINIPAAVVVYFLVSNLLRIGQQGAMWKWDPKLKSEVDKDLNEVEKNTRIIDAKAKPLPKNQKPGGKPGVAKNGGTKDGGSNDAGSRPGGGQAGTPTSSGATASGRQRGSGPAPGELGRGNGRPSGSGGSGSGSGKPNVVKPSGQSGKPGRPPTGAGPGSRQRGPRRGR